jgi:tRNA pseudouridine38-40 synthase
VRTRIETGEAWITSDSALMPRYRATLSYDGTDFLGWQVQARGRTVQGVLEEALATLCGGALIRVVAAGRTDTGVHALGQVTSFDLPSERDPTLLLRALNGLLPHDVRALAVARADDSFNARRDAVSKLYRYVLDCGGIQLPTRRREAAFSPWPLDLALAADVAAFYVGQHDFASLACSGGSVKTTVRTISRSELRSEPAPGPGLASTLIYEVEADGFLRKMVRGLVGGIIEVARGALTFAQLERALKACDRRAWPAPADARGLTLVRVDYP